MVERVFTRYPWYYQGEPVIQKDIPVWAIGFVYRISRIDTGKAYIGQKRLRRKLTRKPLKGKKRKRRSFVQSDWLQYFGSSNDLLIDLKKLGPGKFKREILYWCRSLSEMNWIELKQQVVEEAILRPDQYYNSFIGRRISRSQIRNLLK